MNRSPKGWDIGYSSTNFSAAIFANSMLRSDDRWIWKFSNSQWAYRWGILAVANKRSARAFLTHSHRETPSSPSRETCIQPVPPQAGHVTAGCELTGALYTNTRWRQLR